MGFVDIIKFIVTNPISYHQYQIGTDFLNTSQKLIPSFSLLIPYQALALCPTTYKSYFNFVRPSHWAIWYNLCGIIPRIIYSVNKITTKSSLWKSVEMICCVCGVHGLYRMHMMRKLFCQLFSLELRLSDNQHFDWSSLLQPFFILTPILLVCLHLLCYMLNFYVFLYQQIFNQLLQLR